MSSPVPVRVVGPLAGVDPQAADGDGLAYDGATGTWRRDTVTRAQLSSLDSRVAAIEQAAGGALKGYGTTGRLGSTFGPFGNSGPWVICPPAYRPVVTAAAGDIVEWIPELLIALGADSEHDLAAIVDGQPVRFASSGTATGYANGHGGMYLARSGQFSTSFPTIVWQVQAGDLDEGTLTLALMYRDSGSGNTVGSAAYPSNAISLLNWGPVTASGDDLTGRVTALENARGAASGIATLDATTKVPVAQLPVGTGPATIAAGDDPRLSDARTPTAHAASHATAGGDPLTPGAIGALPASARGTAEGVAPLDSGLLVPVAYLPVGAAAGTLAAGDDPRLSDARAPLAHTHAQAEVTALTSDLAARQQVAEKDQPGGYAGLSASAKLDGTQQVYATQTSSILPVGNTASVGTFDSAARSNHVHAGVALAGDQSIAGIKSFASSPVVPDPTAAGHAVNRAYADTKLAASARGTADGVASLDGSTKVPIGQLPTGSGAGTVAAGDDARLSDARTPTAHAASHATAGTDPLTPAAIGALAATARGAADGVAPLDGGALVPIANLPVGLTAGTVADGGYVGTFSSDIETRVYRLEHNPYRSDRDLYGDVVSSLGREQVTASIPLVNGTVYLIRLNGRRPMQLNAIRMVAATAGVGGTCAIALYEGSTTSNLAQVRSGTISLTPAGRVNHTFGATFTSGTATNLVVGLLPLSYTTPPAVGGISGVVHWQMINPSGSLAVAVTKAAQATLPAAVDLADNSWTLTGTSKLWVALA